LIEAVFFDFGGVIARLDREEIRGVESEYGLPKDGLLKALYGTPEWRKAEVGRGSERDWLAAADRALSELSRRPVPGVRDIASRIWTGLDDNVVALAQRLRGRYRVGLLSNSTKRLERELLPRNGIREMFDVVINSARVGVAKPNARIYHKAAAMIGAEPAACVHIDDFEDNVRGAREAGLAAIHHQGDYAALERELRALGVEW
jgi:putative hydrolase of the HAD superfamily